MCYGRLESLRKHQSPDDDEDDECVCLLACLLVCSNSTTKGKKDKAKKRTTNKKKPNNKTRLKACLIVCLVCLLFGFSENNPKTFPARNQRRKGCFH